MRWMKLTKATDGKEILFNMALATTIIVLEGGETMVSCGCDEGWLVRETPEEIIARGQWEVR